MQRSMPRAARLGWVLTCALGLGLGTDSRGADDLDALSLESAPPPAETRVERPYRLTLEAAAASVEHRSPSDREDGRRASIDFRYSSALSSQWRVTLSDRLDDIHPTLAGQRTTLNSLREAYASWQATGGSTHADIGRVNLRNGPAYGYNPTDYFRAGALRVVTTADPVALREQRQGTVMVRLGQQWESASVSAALAPELARHASGNSRSLDLASTNGETRLLLSGNSRLSERVSAQALLLARPGGKSQLGASATALVSDSAVVYLEASTGRAAGIAATVLDRPEPLRRREQVALGLTYTFPTKMSLTVEAEYNGHGLSRADWNTVLANGPAAYGRYLTLTQRSQELGFRKAWLVYASQKDFLVKQLDFAALARVNAVDHSYLSWFELRHHWQRFDAALQFQRASGDPGTEFGVLPFKQVVQLVGSWYF